MVNCEKCGKKIGFLATKNDCSADDCDAKICGACAENMTCEKCGYIYCSKHKNNHEEPEEEEAEEDSDEDADETDEEKSDDEESEDKESEEKEEALAYYGKDKMIAVLDLSKFEEYSEFFEEFAKLEEARYAFLVQTSSNDYYVFRKG